jgi:hypothetical protein
MTHDEQAALKTLTDKLKVLGGREQTKKTLYEMEKTALKALDIVRQDEETRAVVWYGLARDT